MGEVGDWRRNHFKHDRITAGCMTQRTQRGRYAWFEPAVSSVCGSNLNRNDMNQQLEHEHTYETTSSLFILLVNTVEGLHADRSHKQRD
jgi:hypothetical protein